MPSVCSIKKSTKKYIEFYGFFRAGFKKIVKQKGNQEDLKCKKTLFQLNLFKTSYMEYNLCAHIKDKISKKFS